MSAQSIYIKIFVVVLIVFDNALCEGQVKTETAKFYEESLQRIWKPLENDTISLRLLWEKLNEDDPLLAEVNYPYIQKAIDYAHSQNYPYWEAEFYNRLGWTYKSQSRKDESELAHEKSMQIFKSIDNIERQLGVMHTLMGSYGVNDAAEKALSMGYEALELCSSVNDDSCLGMTYFYMAKTMYNFGEYSKGVEFAEKAIALLENTRKTRSIAECYSDFATYGNYDYTESLSFIDKSLALIRSDTTTTDDDLIRIYFNRIATHDKFGKYQEAEKDINYIDEELNDRLSLRKKQNLTLEKGMNKFNLGNYQEAIAILREGAHDKYSDINPFIYFHYQYIEKSYEALGQLDSAYHYHIILREMAEDSRIHESRMKMKDLEAKYEAEKKELTIAAQNQTIANQKIIQWLGLGATMLLGLFLFQTYRNAQQRRKANEQLIELDKLKTRLYTNITHEFRTPLTVILGMAAQVKRNPSKYLNNGTELIQKNGERLMELINQMLDLSKLESGAMTTDNVQSNIIDYIRYISYSFESLAANKNIDIHFVSEEEEVIMDYDEEKIKTVLANLFSNAIKFTPENGNIYVIIRQLEDSKTPLLQLKFKDTGIGIDEEKLPYIFDRFYQTEAGTTRQGEGTGIGLALVKEYVQLMNGSISVKSKKGTETEFTLLLPITNLAKVNKTISTSTTVKTQISTPKSIYDDIVVTKNDMATILLVEDNLDVATYVASCLDQIYNVIIGNNGKEGVELALKHIPDVVITDVMMPIKDGYEVCKDLKTNSLTSHIPVIMLTAKADNVSKLEGLKYGADAYLAKPFDKEELITRIKNLLTSRKNIQKYYLALTTGEKPENIDHDIPKVEDQFVTALTDIVTENISDSSFTVDVFAKEMYMSSSQFHRKVAGVTGLSPMKFVRHIRLSKAKQLLSESEEAISSIAYKTGYNDPAYFSRIFKKEFDVTPIQWRTNRQES